MRLGHRNVWERHRSYHDFSFQSRISRRVYEKDFRRNYDKISKRQGLKIKPNNESDETPKEQKKH